MARQDQRLVDDGVGSHGEERRIEGIPQPLREPRGPRRMPQCDVQDVMCNEADLLWQGQEVEAWSVKDGFTFRRRGSCPIAMAAPERKDRKGCIYLSQMGDGLRGADRMPSHGRPRSRRSAA